MCRSHVLDTPSRRPSRSPLPSPPVSSVRRSSPGGGDGLRPSSFLLLVALASNLLAMASTEHSVLVTFVASCSVRNARSPFRSCPACALARDSRLRGYKPQIEFLDAEVARMVAMAPTCRRLASTAVQALLARRARGREREAKVSVYVF